MFATIFICVRIFLGVARFVILCNKFDMVWVRVYVRMCVRESVRTIKGKWLVPLRSAI